MATFNEAVQSLAKGITSKNKSLNKQEELSIAKELLKHANPVNHSRWSEIEINLDSSDQENLQEYLGELQDAYNQEVGKDINQAINKVEKTTNLRNRLQQEVNQALSETKELEKIAKRLQDKGIGKIAGKEEDQVNKLGEDLERINREGKELEKDKQKITQILNHHNIDQSDLHEELKNRASSVGTILQAAGSGTGGSTSNLNQIVQRIIQKESRLKDAEDKNLHKIESDIRTLARIVDIEKQEMEALNYVESKMKQGELQEAAKLLDNLIGKRQDFGNKKDYSQVRQDLKDERKIIQAVGELFESINSIEKQGISRSRLYDALASQGSFSSSQEAKNVLERIENEFEEMEEEVKKIKSLREEERKLENLEHDKLKQIDKEDAQLRDKASTQEKRELKSIHEKLEKLGFNLNNEIDLSNNGSSNSGTVPNDSCPNCGSSNFSNNKCQKCSSHVIECVNCQAINTRYDSEKLYNVRCRNCGQLHVENWQNTTSNYQSVMAPIPSGYGKDDHPYFGEIGAPNSWWYSKNYKSNDEGQGYKIHVSGHPENAAQIIKKTINGLNQANLEHKFAYNPDKLFYHQIKDQLIKNDRISSNKSKDGTKGKVLTIYPHKDDNPHDKVNNNYETTKKAIKIIANALGDQNIYGGPKIQTEGEIPVEYKGKPTRIWIRYDKIGGNSWIDGDGNKHGRKSGLEPSDIPGLINIPDLEKFL